MHIHISPYLLPLASPSHPPYPTPLGGHKAPSWSPCAMRLLHWGLLEEYFLNLKMSVVKDATKSPPTPTIASWVRTLQPQAWELPEVLLQVQTSSPISSAATQVTVKPNIREPEHDHGATARFPQHDAPAITCYRPLLHTHTPFSQDAWCVMVAGLEWTSQSPALH